MLDLKEMSHFGGHLLEPQWGGRCGRKHIESTAIQVLPSGTAVDISNWSLPLWDWGCLAALQGLILQANAATDLESTCYMKPTCSAGIRDGGRIRGLLWGIEWRATLSCGLLFGYGGTELGKGLRSDRDLTPAECVLTPLHPLAWGATPSIAGSSPAMPAAPLLT